MQVSVRARLHGAVAAAAPSASHAAAAACVTVVVMSLNHLQPHHAPALAEQLSKFPALKHLDVSANPGLRCTGAAVMLSALSGKILSTAFSVLYFV
jgi:hypothetical protein